MEQKYERCKRAVGVSEDPNYCAKCIKAMDAAHSIMPRARAARHILETKEGRGMELRAFLSIFHPDMSEERARSIIRDVERT